MRTRVRKQPIIALNFKSETILKFYNLEACKRHSMAFRWRADDGPQLVDFCQLKNVRVGRTPFDKTFWSRACDPNSDPFNAYA